MSGSRLQLDASMEHRRGSTQAKKLCSSYCRVAARLGSPRQSSALGVRLRCCSCRVNFRHRSRCVASHRCSHHVAIRPGAPRGQQ
ncbi:hypothetical protein GUJ93_ZPchr0458g22735 [Zizania palustris]|uniref:Uncharacterized protein n=1 Tax=Zizania palustris TaxID=103762 RepID=A0A8J5VDN4_ZIZPA|nr:hypothetical protein GUJ93_ZPchr0458g22735 [Zizania palustris]